MGTNLQNIEKSDNADKNGCRYFRYCRYLGESIVPVMLIFLRIYTINVSL